MATTAPLPPALRLTLIVIGVLLLTYAIYAHELLAGLVLLALIVVGVVLILFGAGLLRRR
jgi:hypothetical protein